MNSYINRRTNDSMHDTNEGENYFTIMYTQNVGDYSKLGMCFKN